MTIVTVSETPIIIHTDNAQGPAGPSGATSYGTVETVNFVSDLVTTSFASSTKAVRILGYSAVGVGGLNVRRVSSQPTHPWKFRSADRYLANGTLDSANGGWWEGYSDDYVVSPEMFGAKGDGATDDYTAISNCITYAESQVPVFYQASPLISVRFSPKQYICSQTLHSYQTVRYFCHGNGMEGNYHAHAFIIFPAGVEGWRIHAIPTGGGGTPRFEHIKLTSSYTTPDYIHGWRIEWAVVMEGCGAQGFAGNGFNINGASNGAGFDGTVGLTDFARFTDCTGTGNGMNGFYCYGQDANVMVFDLCSATFNKQFGFRDDGFLGNEYRSCHTSANGHQDQVPTPFVNHNGKAWAVVPIALNLKLTNTVSTEPGTNSAVWRQVSDSPIAPQDWSPTQSPVYQAGGAYCFNAQISGGGLYAEGAQGPSWGYPPNPGITPGLEVWGTQRTFPCVESGIRISMPHQPGSPAGNTEDMTLYLGTNLGSRSNDTTEWLWLSSNETGDLAANNGGKNDKTIYFYERNTRNLSNSRWAFGIAGNGPSYTFGAPDNSSVSGIFMTPRFGLGTRTSDFGIVIDAFSEAPHAGEKVGAGWLRFNSYSAQAGSLLGWVCTTAGASGSTAAWKSMNTICGPYTVATLPSPGIIGNSAWVTDGDAALAWGATVVNSGAGATKYLVWYNGTNWTVVGK